MKLSHIAYRASFFVILTLLLSNSTMPFSVFEKGKSPQKAKTSPLEVPTFELWNDTNQDIYFYFGKSELREALRDAEKLGVGHLAPGQYTEQFSLAAISEVSPENNILIILAGSMDPEMSRLQAYFFNPSSSIGKKLYLKFGKNYNLEPQEGALFGFGGKSKGGFPLKNNVTKNDFTFYPEYHSIPALIQNWKTYINPLWTTSQEQAKPIKNIELIEQKAWETFPLANQLRKQGANQKDIDYAVLGLQSGASHTEIRKAYLQLSRKWHPDKHKNDPLATEIFKIIGEAYSNLTK